VVVATVVALLTALVTGTLTAQAAASATYEPLPTAAELAELGAVIAPGVPLSVTERNNRPPAIVSEEPGYGYARLAGETSDASGDLHSYTDGVTARLRQAGWQTRWIAEAPPRDPESTEVVHASKAGLRLAFWTYRSGFSAADPGLSSAAGEPVVAGGDPYYSLDVALHRTVSRGVLVAAAIGAVIGLALGWLLAGWASRRTQHHLWASSTLAVLTAVAGLTAAPLVWYTLVEYVDARAADRGYDLPFSGWLFTNGLLTLTAPAGLALIAAAVVTVPTWPGRARGWTVPAAPARRLPRILTAVLLAVVVVTLAGAYLVGYGLTVLGRVSVVTAAGVAAVVLIRAVTHFRRAAPTASPHIGE
jgi:hypothetical protein